MPKVLSMSNWRADPIPIKGGRESALPERCRLCGGELVWWESWGNTPADYRCDYCGQVYRLTGPFKPWPTPLYD